MNRATPPSAVEVLRARAVALARAETSTSPANSVVEVLEFRLGQETYAIETKYVREVFPLKELTPLPGTPAFLLGIAHVRGRILPVYDLRKFFDLPDAGITDLHRIILVRDSTLDLGLLADMTVGVRQIPLSNLQTSLPTLTGVRSDFLKGVTAERLIVLDMGRVLADPRLIIDDRA